MPDLQGPIASEVRDRDNCPAIAQNGARRGRKPQWPIDVDGLVKIRPCKWHDKTRDTDYGAFMLTYRDATGRRREKRATLEAAKARAGVIITNILNGQAAMNNFKEADRASYHRALDLLRPTGRHLEVACAEYASALDQLAGAMSIQEAVKFAMEHRPAAVVPKTVPQLVQDLLDTRRQDGIGERWAATLESELNRFAEFWTGPIHLVRAPDINNWLRGLKKPDESPVGPRTRANYRAALHELFAHAKQTGHLSKTWDELSDVPAAKPEDAEIRIITPEQVSAMLARAPDTMVPFIALAAFAGIRHEEMAPYSKGKKPLDWSDIDWKESTIYVQKRTAKTGQDRLVPMQPNLVAWLEAFRKPNGRICRLANASHALARTKRKAGIPTGPNETRNTLRKSFISYRLAMTKNIAQVAEEAGNSPAKIESNYKRPVPESEGERWFAVWPDNPRCVQLPLPIPDTLPAYKFRQAKP